MRSVSPDAEDLRRRVEPHRAPMAAAAGAAEFLAARPRYAAVDPAGDLIHGDNLFDVAKRAGTAWRWNERALTSLALFGHTLGEETLCEGIHRMPFGAEAVASAGAVRFRPLPVAPIEWDQRPDIETAVAQLEAAFGDCVSGGGDIHLSLSAGYDSRLLLALCLKNGIAPRISVMGHAGSTDVVAAAEICRRLGLPLDIVEVKRGGYLDSGPQIARDTSGVKLAVHWHTWLYARDKGHVGTHLVGSNGEFARSFYFDRRRLNPAADRLPAGALRAYWLARLAYRSRKFSKLNPIARPGAAGWTSLLARTRIDRRWRADRLATALDAFYAEQRVRHLIGSGLACYARFGEPRSPFLDGRWIAAAAALQRQFKRRNRFHAMTTERLRPQLAELPYNQLPTGGQGSGYAPLDELLADRRIFELIAESAVLDRWTTRQQRLAILDDPACSQLEERSFWLTLHFAASAVGT